VRSSRRSSALASNALAISSGMLRSSARGGDDRLSAGAQRPNPFHDDFVVVRHANARHLVTSTVLAAGAPRGNSTPALTLSCRYTPQDIAA
jgi:hypothetical protein